MPKNKWKIIVKVFRFSGILLIEKWIKKIPSSQAELRLRTSLCGACLQFTKTIRPFNSNVHIKCASYSADVRYLRSIIFWRIICNCFNRFAFVCVLIYSGRAHTTSDKFILPNCVFFVGECVCWWFLYGRFISVSRSSMSIYFYWLTYSCTAFVLVFSYCLEDNFLVKKINVSHSTGNRNYSSFIVVEANGSNTRNEIFKNAINKYSNGTDEHDYIIFDFDSIHENTEMNFIRFSMIWRQRKKNNQQINKTAFSSFFPFIFHRARTHLKWFTLPLRCACGYTYIYARYIDQWRKFSSRHATAFFLLLLISFLLHLPHKTIMLLNCCRNIIFECVLEWSKKKNVVCERVAFQWVYVCVFVRCRRDLTNL